MKKLIILYILFVPAVVLGQQFPSMEGYNINPFTLSPAYAGLQNNKTLFMDYRSDWSGIDGGPQTYQLSYSDKFRDKVGLGGRFIYDKTDIFKQTLFLGTYTYEVNILKEHTLNFGLSLGFYRNSIDLSKYYNDPQYIEDMVLLYGQQTSKLKFATDFSVLYRHNHLEAGLVFSNLMFGIARYRNSDMTYKPFKNYVLHTSYLFRLDDKWSLKPTILLRGGQNIPFQLDVSSAATWNERVWATTLVRTSGIFGIGLGGEVHHGILINYIYNMSDNLTTNIPITAFGTHQITLGIRIFNYLKDKSVSGS
jgi:type IX secretion system PorP/SprF family membrane protein